ncbi:hypothetical protein ACJJTC_005020, partial [Scirpophaga incertulas]
MPARQLRQAPHHAAPAGNYARPPAAAGPAPRRPRRYEKDSLMFIDAEGDTDDAKERKRLKFITTTSGAKKKIDAAKTELDKPTTETLQKGTEEEAQSRLEQKIAQLNAALAALVAAHC